MRVACGIGADFIFNNLGFGRPMINHVARSVVVVLALCVSLYGEDAKIAPQQAPSGSTARAFIDGNAPGWKPLTKSDWVNVNCADETWLWLDDRVVCSGEPVGVIRTKRQYTNFELLAEWKHDQEGGNSGVFVWTADKGLADLKPGQLPNCGIEVQVLDHEFAKQYERSSGKKADWFTTHGDVFPVGTAKMKPFEPTSPSGERSFPREHHSRGVGQWNHYYIRCINGEVRLWVNGVEVSGGRDCDPAKGFLCLESEGAPIEFRNLKIRELP